MSNYEDALKAEAKRVTRCFQKYLSYERATHAASHRLGHRKRIATGEFFYVHPALPSTAFPTRKRAACLNKTSFTKLTSIGYFAPRNEWEGQYLVLLRCKCGAKRATKRGESSSTAPCSVCLFKFSNRDRSDD